MRIQAKSLAQKEKGERNEKVGLQADQSYYQRHGVEVGLRQSRIGARGDQ